MLYFSSNAERVRRQTKQQNTSTVTKDFHSNTLSTNHNTFCYVAGANGDQGSKGDKGLDGNSGVKYVRWGRTTCPGGAEIVYKGT